MSFVCNLRIRLYAMLYIVVTTDYIHQNTTSIIANPVQVQDIYLGCCIHHSEERNLTKIQLKQAHRFLYLMNVLNNLLKLVIIKTSHVRMAEPEAIFKQLNTRWRSINRDG